MAMTPGASRAARCGHFGRTSLPLARGAAQWPRLFSSAERAVAPVPSPPLAARERGRRWPGMQHRDPDSTSNGMMVAAELGTRLTTAAILSAVRSCSSRPSSGEKLRRGSTTVTCVPLLFRLAAASSTAARAAAGLGCRSSPAACPARTAPSSRAASPRERCRRRSARPASGRPQAARVPDGGERRQVHAVHEDQDHPAAVVRLPRLDAGRSPVPDVLQDLGLHPVLPVEPDEQEDQQRGR